MIPNSLSQALTPSAVNLGLGEMAIRVAGAIQVAPATLNGAPVAAAPIRVPFTFELEGRQRDS
jgi:hypothetical protein